jgi:O-antigen/teichoic acid export membrane protein
VIVRAGGEVIAKAASFVFFVSLAREVGTADFGAFMFALGLTGVLALVAGFGTDALVAREVDDETAAAGPLLADVGSMKALVAVCLLVVAVGVVGLGDFSHSTTVTVAIVGLGATIEVIAKSWDAVLLGHERLDLVSMTTIVQRMTTTLAWLAVVVVGPSLLAASLCFLGGALAGLAADEWAVRRVVGRRPRPDPTRWWKLAKAGVPFGIASVLFLLLLRLDVVLLSFLSGESQVGYYAAAYRLAESGQFIAWAIGAATLPWLVRRASDGVARGCEIALKASNLVLAPISAVLGLFAVPAVQLLYGDEFRPSVIPLQLIAATAACYGVQSVAATVLVARNQPWHFTRLVGLVAAGNVAANLVLIPRYGANGAAGVALASSAALAIASFLALRRRFGHVGIWRCSSGALAGIAAMAAVRACPWPDGAELVLGVVAYVATVGVVEWVAFPDDVRFFRRSLPSAWIWRGAWR